MSKAAFLKEHLREGEHYAGIVLGKNNEPDYHVFLLPNEADGVTFKQAQSFAKKAGGDLPTRREQSLLFANLKEQFKPLSYWSGEVYAPASGSAWGQDFHHGYQYAWGTYNELRARAIRRVQIGGQE